jgi:hypothetical protein
VQQQPRWQKCRLLLLQPRPHLAILLPGQQLAMVQQVLILPALRQLRPQLWAILQQVKNC